MLKGFWIFAVSSFLVLSASSDAFARACDFGQDKFQEWARLDDGQIQSKCDKNIGAEADKIATDDRASRMSACLYAYKVAKTEAQKYINLRTKNCATIVEKSKANPDSCSDSSNKNGQRVCLEKVAANLREAAALEEQLMNAMKLAQVSADAAVKYSIEAIEKLSETEAKIVEAVNNEIGKVVDVSERQKAESIIRNANVIQSGQLLFGSSGEVRADQAGPGVSTISGFKERVPVMIRQQEDAASLAKNFSEQAKGAVDRHGQNIETYKSLAEQAAARASGISTTTTNKSEDDFVPPIPRPRPKPEELAQLNQGRGGAGSGQESTLSKSAGSESLTGGGLKEDGNIGSANEGDTLIGPAKSSGSGGLGSLGSVGTAGAAAAAAGARPKPGVSSDEWGAAFLPVNEAIQSANAPRSTNLAESANTKKNEVLSSVDPAIDSKTEANNDPQKVGAQVAIQGTEKGSALSGTLTGGQSRLPGGGYGDRGLSASSSQRLSGSARPQERSLDPAVKNFQTDLSQGGLPMNASDIQNSFQELASELGIETSNGLTLEENEAFSSLQNSSDGRRNVAANSGNQAESQFDASVEGTEGKALFLRTKYAHIRAVKKGLLIQNLKSKL